MMAALTENIDWFRPRVNIAVLLAPVANVYRMKSPSMQKMKNKETFAKLIKKMGPEMFPKPQATGKFMSNFLKIT